MGAYQQQKAAIRVIPPERAFPSPDGASGEIIVEVGDELDTGGIAVVRGTLDTPGDDRPQVLRLYHLSLTQNPGTLVGNLGEPGGLAGHTVVQQRA